MCTRRVWWAPLLLLPLLLAGCSFEPPTYPVSGTVTYEGKPVPDGDILFIPADNSVGPVPGKIIAGRYEVRTRAGVQKVQISASKIIPGGMRGGANEPVPEEYIPEIYNVKSTLKAEVTPDGDNKFDFKLLPANPKGT